jgi:hypothetical protein
VRLWLGKCSLRVALPAVAAAAAAARPGTAPDWVEKCGLRPFECWEYSL